MRQGYSESPLNNLPAVLWVLALPILASEAVFLLARLGFLNGSLGGGQGAAIAMRQIAAEKFAYLPAMGLRFWQTGSIGEAQIWRALSYPFIHPSFTPAVFVVVFLLALGNMVASVFRPWAVVALFLGSAIGGALALTVLGYFVPKVQLSALIGGYPAVYGLVGAFTFLLWIKLGQERANQLRAFTLIGLLLAFQLVFAIIFRDGSFLWVADIAGFATGFLLSFVVIPGGLTRVLRIIRQR